MPDNTPQNPNSNKKARLGRGLGSLLGGSMGGSFGESTENQAMSTTHPGQTHRLPSPGSVSNQQTSQMASHDNRNSTSASSTGGTSNNTAAKVPTSTEPQPKIELPIAAPLSASHSPAHVAEQSQISQQTATLREDNSQRSQRSSAVIATPITRPINEESQIWMIPVERLQPNTQQPRQVFTPDGLKDLTASVKEKGILQPIVARRLSEREFEIIAGERRWRAAQAAGLKQVPVILKKVSEQDSLELAIIENIQRENLNPIDEAEAFQHLVTDYSMTQQQVADKLGKERSSIANSLRLLSLPGEVRLMLKSEHLSAGHAKVLLGLDNKVEQIRIAQLVMSDTLSVRATEKLVAQAKINSRTVSSDSTKPTSPTQISQRLVDSLSIELQKLIGTKVVIDYADTKGKIAMHFYSDDQLNQMVERLRKAWQN